MRKIIVVGGGAAGMLAAIAAANEDTSVTLIEKNEKLGKKVYITGKGRCNVTNASDIETILENVCSNSKFLYSAIYSFDNQALMEIFEKNGCPLKVERGERVFPVSDHSSDIIKCLRQILEKKGVLIRYNTCVKELIIVDNQVEGVVTTDGKREHADAVIVCTGGLSYPVCGSTGDGYRFAKDSGHLVTKRYPALVPMVAKEQWCEKLMGLSLKNVSIRLLAGEKNKELYSGFGEMLFTHFGVSGPLILSASSYYTACDHSVPARLLIDLKPALSKEQLDKRLLRDWEENRSKQFKNALGGLFPQRLIEIMVALSGIAPEKKVCDITKTERMSFIELIKAVPLTIIGLRGFDEAIITKGGVSVKDINPSTMESKKVKQLYFAGEVLDLDALTGGYNLQIAWSTGHLAGECAAKR